MKKLLSIALLLLLFTACNSTSSIVTSKEEAQKKGMYAAPKSSKPIASIGASQKRTVKKMSNTTLPKDNTIPKNNSRIATQNETDIFTDDDDTSYLVRQIINAASDNLGVTYRSGGTTKDGFDCSGLMYSTFKKFDIVLPRSSHEMAEVGTKVDMENAKKGDLIFFINRGQKHINHVGMIVEVNADEIKFIHSSTQSGVIISSLREAYYARTFAQINRIVE